MIESSERDGIAFVTLAHGKANAMDTEFCAAVTKAFAKLKTSKARAVVLTGQGGMFSAGVNLIRARDGGARYIRKFLPVLNTMFDTVFNFPKPVVAAINGHAIAGGCVLAICCDLRVMSDDARLRIGLNEVALGLEFPPKILALARRRVSRRWIDRVLLEAGLHAPAEALELGLVDEVAADCVGTGSLACQTTSPLYVENGTRLAAISSYAALYARSRSRPWDPLLISSALPPLVTQLAPLGALYSMTPQWLPFSGHADSQFETIVSWFKAVANCVLAWASVIVLESGIPMTRADPDFILKPPPPR